MSWYGKSIALKKKILDHCTSVDSRPDYKYMNKYKYKYKKCKQYVNRLKISHLLIISYLPV